MKSDNYEVMAFIKAVEGQAEPISESEFLNFDPCNPRRCRFCLKTDSALFQNRSHTFPEGLGNRWHISWDECDECNRHFARFDNHLCAAFGTIRTYSGIRGKKGVPSSGRVNGTHIITHNEVDGTNTKILDARFGITPSEGEGFFFGDDTAIYLSPTPDGGFTPRKAFKALMKIGFAILPVSELENFERLREWMQAVDDELDFPFLKVSIAFDEIINAPKAWSATLHRRRPEQSNVPYCRLVFTVGPVCIIVDLMPDSLDEHIGLQYFITDETKFDLSFEFADGSYASLCFKNFTSLDWSSSSRVETPIAAMVVITDRDGMNTSIAPILRP